MIPYYLIIQSAYSDEDAELSARRLEISRHTVIVALRFQTFKPIVHVAVCRQDPHLEERIALFQSSGCEVRPILVDRWDLYGGNWEIPEGRKIVGRIDDDDLISADYCERNLRAAPAEGEIVLIWPTGYIFWRDRAYLHHHPGNQFIAIVTDRNIHPHQEQHWMYPQLYKSKTVSRDPGWIWVRHGAASTSTLPRYRTRILNGIDSKRIPVNLRAVTRAIAPCGIASGNYEEHVSPHVKYVFRQNSLHTPCNTRNLIAITTYNPNNSGSIAADFVKTLTSVRMYSKSDILIVDDGSHPQYLNRVRGLAADYQARLIERGTNGGISAAKTTCLRAFLEDSYDYCFLLDDDVEVFSPQFEALYVNSMKKTGVGILSFNDPQCTVTNPTLVHEDLLVATDHTCGCCVVVSRDCAKATGGYPELPGPWGSEHLEYYCRAARGGFADLGCFLDIPGSKHLLRIASHQSVFTREQKNASHRKNLEILLKNGVVWPETLAKICQWEGMEFASSHSESIADSLGVASEGCAS